MVFEIQPHAIAQIYHYTSALLLLIKMSPSASSAILWSMSDVEAFDHLVRTEQVVKTFFQNSLIIEQDIINS